MRLSTLLIIIRLFFNDIIKYIIKTTFINIFMIQLFKGLYNYLFEKPTYRILIIGPESMGKTVNIL